MVSLLPFSCHPPFRHAVRRTPPPQSLRPPPLQHQPARDALHILLTGPFVAPQGKALDASLQTSRWDIPMVLPESLHGHVELANDQHDLRGAVPDRPDTGSGVHGQRCRHPRPCSGRPPRNVPSAKGVCTGCWRKTASGAGQLWPIETMQAPGAVGPVKQTRTRTGAWIFRPGRETTARNLQRI